MRAVITVIGKDAVGIIATVSAILQSHRANILDITQSVLSDLFAMIMLVDISKCDVDLPDLAEQLDTAGREMNLSIHTTHEDVFNSMHRI